MNALHTTSGVTHYYCQWRQATCIYATSHSQCAITACIGPISGIEYSYAVNTPTKEESKMKKVEIYWEDLVPEKQEEILTVFGDNGNYDVFPVFTLESEDEENGI